MSLPWGLTARKFNDEADSCHRNKGTGQSADDVTRQSNSVTSKHTNGPSEGDADEDIDRDQETGKHQLLSKRVRGQAARKARL